MKDADLLDLLEILGDIAEGILSSGRGEDPYVPVSLAQRKIESFRSAIRQRMMHSQEIV
jgi:hypothetical protein